MRANVVELAQLSADQDFKEYVFDFLGDLSAYEILGERVLIATYVPPEKTKGGIIMPGRKVTEARFTGVCGLVIKLGNAAFKYMGPYPWDETVPRPKVGDWVQFEPSSGREFFLGPKGEFATNDHGISCRMMPSDLISAIVDDPQRVGAGNGFENLGG